MGDRLIEPGEKFAAVLLCLLGDWGGERGGVGAEITCTSWYCTGKAWGLEG